MVIRTIEPMAARWDVRRATVRARQICGSNMQKKSVCCERASACAISARLQARALTLYASVRASSVEALENKCPKWHIVILIKVLTLDYCKTILNQGERKFNDEEIKEIRTYLYFIGQFEMETNSINNKQI